MLFTNHEGNNRNKSHTQQDHEEILLLMKGWSRYIVVQQKVQGDEVDCGRDG